MDTVATLLNILTTKDGNSGLICLIVYVKTYMHLARYTIFR